MDELISRQAAIEAVHKAVLEMFDYCDDDFEEPMTYTDEKMLAVNKMIVGRIRELPSAQRNTDEWCTDCKEYDQEKHCCPRWNRVIRETLKDAQPDIAEDGTLTVTVRQGAEVGRVLVQEAGTTNGALFYRDARPEQPESAKEYCAECDHIEMCQWYPYEGCEFRSLPSAQPEEVIPHRNYKYLSDYWCECGWHLGKKGEVKYCSECGRKVNWDG